MSAYTLKADIDKLRNSLEREREGRAKKPQTQLEEILLYIKQEKDNAKEIFSP